MGDLHCADRVCLLADGSFRDRQELAGSCCLLGAPVFRFDKFVPPRMEQEGVLGFPVGRVSTSHFRSRDRRAGLATWQSYPEALTEYSCLGGSDAGAVLSVEKDPRERRDVIRLERISQIAPQRR